MHQGWSTFIHALVCTRGLSPCVLPSTIFQFRSSQVVGHLQLMKEMGQSSMTPDQVSCLWEFQVVEHALVHWAFVDL